MRNQVTLMRVINSRRGFSKAEAVVKGQTASSSYKPAILTNGARVTVPPHIETGDKIKINSKELTYIEKSK